LNKVVYWVPILSILVLNAPHVYAHTSAYLKGFELALQHKLTEVHKKAISVCEEDHLEGTDVLNCVGGYNAALR